jgi:hypothetical protein
MPNWIPAKQRGNPVKCQFNLPIEYNIYKNKIEESEGFKVSKYWGNKGKKKMMQACIKDYKKLFSECNCWYYFIVWNYNENKLNDLDLQTIFEKQICQ